MRFLFGLILALIANALSAQVVHDIKVKSEIDDVTVFITGGEVHRTAKVNVKEGRNKLVFTGISTVADNKSVQFTSDKAFSLVSVSSEIDYLSIGQSNERVTVLRDSLELLKGKLSDYQNEKAAYSDEQALLRKNNAIKGEQDNLSVEELQSMAEYYRMRMMELYKTISDYDKKIQEVNQKIYRYQNQLTELNYKETIKSNQIHVIIDSDISTSMNVDLKYVVSNCGWQANYDLVAKNVDENITIKYKAKVYNNTGNDWNNVGLVLSTADPNISASAPNLKPWYLNQYSLQNSDELSQTKGTEGYVIPQNRAYKKFYQNASTPQMNQNLDGFVTFGNDAGGVFNNGAPNPGNTVTFTTIQVSQLSTEFQIADPYTIPADSKPYLVDITEHSLEATYTYKAVPKLDKDAFLLANIVGWEKLELIPGPTQVYFADTYVGQSYINTANVGDTLRLSFGRDKKIIVERKLLEEFSDKKVVGGNRKDQYMYEIKLKNNHTIPVTINLLDQIPISQDSDISVSVDEISGAQMKDETGILKWLIRLEPGGTSSVRLGFTIKYDKEKKIRVKQYRSVAAPAYQ
ncbi:MAG: DUF4139 domain-containing protein [Crocinitomicaceae bacterium]|nr:DUF4139 domain-containing protein [Crocinitomicaceae bacterium]